MRPSVRGILLALAIVASVTTPIWGPTLPGGLSDGQLSPPIELTVKVLRADGKTVVIAMDQKPRAVSQQANVVLIMEDVPGFPRASILGQGQVEEAGGLEVVARVEPQRGGRQ